MTNNNIPEIIGLIINAYKPAPNNAAQTDNAPTVICIIKLLQAIYLNFFSL